MSKPTLAVLDFESTGVDPRTARIVTAYLGVLDENGNEMAEDSDEYLVCQDEPIPAGAIAIHGITTEHANANGRPLADVMSVLLGRLHEMCVTAGLPLVGHNVAYDLTLLDAELHSVYENPTGVAEWISTYKVPVLDTYVLDKHFDRYRNGKRTLTATAEHYGVKLTAAEAHGAKADAIASGRIALFLLNQDAMVGVPYHVIHDAQVVWAREQRASLHDYFLKLGDTEAAASVRFGWPVEGA